MKDRPDLWAATTTEAEKKSVRGWVERQGTIRGLGLVDFNFPQHLKPLNEDSGVGSGDEDDGRLSVAEAKQALRGAQGAQGPGLKCGAVCLRYPSDSMRPGSFTHPDPRVREEAVALTIQAGLAAQELAGGGPSEVVVWSAFDGYDYALQVDHEELWGLVVQGFQKVCDALGPQTKVSLEFKPTDENTRFFTVPSTGAALLLCRDVGRDNFGLTLDVGHCLAAGENPAQSAAMALREGKLFGVQLNDGYTRLGAEDGLMFGSVHPGLALELIVWLVKGKFAGHVYFDTFPRNEDPVRECEANINTCKRMWAKAVSLLEDPRLPKCWAAHDGLSALQLLGLIENE